MAQKHQKHNWSQQQSWWFDSPSLGVSVTEQADNLNDHFSDVCCQLPPLRLESLPSYLPAPPPPTIHVWEVQNRLSKLNASKAGHPEDIPVKIIKEFSFELTEPLTKIFNASLQEGVFPSVWKTASIIPVPKVKNPASANEAPLFLKHCGIGHLKN